jgi:hypothetical protein
MEIVYILLHILGVLVGVAIIIGTCLSTIKTFVLPRSSNDFLTSIVFQVSWFFFRLGLRKTTNYFKRDRAMAFFAPLTLMALPGVWLVLVFIAYTFVFWGVGVHGGILSLKTSGSSLFTLGFVALDDLPLAVIGFSESALGLGLLALLIAYLPTLYSSFSKREALVTWLAVRAGTPASATEMIIRFNALERLHLLDELWVSFENWFVDLDETHTSLAMLVFFRSPQPERSWVVAAGTVMDAAALTASTLDIKRNPQADLCIRAGFIALRHIGDFFRIAYDPDPKPTDPISLTKADFNQAYDRMQAAGVPLKPDREQAWRDFAGWRVNYDQLLLFLAEMTMSPEAPWLTEKMRKQNILYMNKHRTKMHPLTSKTKK